MIFLCTGAVVDLGITILLSSEMWLTRVGSRRMNRILTKLVVSAERLVMHKAHRKGLADVDAPERAPVHGD